MISFHKALTVTTLVTLALVINPQCGAGTEPFAPLPDGFLGIRPLEAVIRYEQIRKEIEFTDAQLVEARNLLNEYREMGKNAIREARRYSNEEADVFLNTELPKHKTLIRVRFDEVLRPEQDGRLQQIVLQQSIRYFGVLILQSDAFAEILGLNDEQHAAWKVVLQREHKRLNDAGKIRAANRTEIIDAVLTDLQQAKFDDIYGERYRAGSLPAPDEDEGIEESIPWSANVNLLRFADVRKELEVIEEQHKQLKTLLISFADDYEAARRNGLKGRELEDLVASLVEREQSQLSKILLPHQLKRLHQLVFQAAVYQYRRDPLRSPIVAEALALTKRQQKELSRKLDEYDAESKLNREERWKDALGACIDALLPEQQARYYRLIGKPFEPS